MASLMALDKQLEVWLVLAPQLLLLLLQRWVSARVEHSWLRSGHQ